MFGPPDRPARCGSPSCGCGRCPSPDCRCLDAQACGGCGCGGGGLCSFADCVCAPAHDCSGCDCGGGGGCPAADCACAPAAVCCGAFSCGCDGCDAAGCGCRGVGGFVRVAGGSFPMGYCPTGRHVTPVRTVTISTFYMGRFAVTQGEWYDATGENPSHFQGAAITPGVNWRNLPVENVSWLDAVAFANAKSVRAGLEPAYAIDGGTAAWDRGSNGFRLPTEAEWEFAARGGTVCGGGFVFPGSDDHLEVGWHGANAYQGRIQEVGLLMPNALGLYDMAGNVVEWVYDRRSPYPDHDETDPSGWQHGNLRAARSAPASGYHGYSRTVVRTFLNPENRSLTIGFRLARPADMPAEGNP